MVPCNKYQGYKIGRHTEQRRQKKFIFRARDSCGLQLYTSIPYSTALYVYMYLNGKTGSLCPKQACNVVGVREMEVQNHYALERNIDDEL